MTTTETNVETNVAQSWLALMDLVPGEEVMIIPTGSQGNGFQGTLIDFVADSDGPIMFVIEKTGSPRCTINWTNVVMVTRALAVDAPEVPSLEEIADQLGIDLPTEEELHAAFDAKQAAAAAENA